VTANSSGVVRSVIQTLRIRHWAKNLLLFAPAAAAHSLRYPVFVDLVLGFLAFSAFASAVYVVNDLIDIEHDRQHPRKKHRAFASGALSVGHARLLLAVLGLIGLAVAFNLPEQFSAVLVGYLLLNVIYSLVLKNLLMIDVLALTSFYVLRLVAGGLIAGVALSGWFIAFFTLLLASIAMSKRVAELQTNDLLDRKKVPGRAYRVEDFHVLSMVGIASAVSAIVVYGLYISDHAVATLYPNPEFLWAGLPLMLYWVGRMWILIGRGELSDDPVDFLVRDPTTYAVAVGVALSVWVASLSSLG